MQSFIDSIRPALDFIKPALLPMQILALVLVTILILAQNRGAGLSSSFGGSNEVYLTRRGIEKSVVNFTIAFLVVFVILRILSLYI
jgi:protein translocase SecG subunit